MIMKTLLLKKSQIYSQCFAFISEGFSTSVSKSRAFVIFETPSLSGQRLILNVYRQFTNVM